MLTMEKIKELLGIDTQNKTDNRALRVMSCDNPVKELFIYRLRQVKEELGLDPHDFTEQLAMCIYKFNSDVSKFLNGTLDTVNVKDSTIKLDSTLIDSAIYELYSFCALLITALEDLDRTTLNKILHFKFEKYVAILELTGLVDVSNDIYRSKLLDRILNIKEQVVNFKEERMSDRSICKEFREHITYFKNQLELIEKYELTEEDFLIYAIMFDIRHYKRNRKHKVSVRH